MCACRVKTCREIVNISKLNLLKLFSIPLLVKKGQTSGKEYQLRTLSYKFQISNSFIGICIDFTYAISVTYNNSRILRFLRL